MQEILTHTPSIVVDDQLKGIVPYLPLDPPRPAPARRRSAAARIARPRTGATR